MDKQNVMLSEIYHLKCLNKQLEDECHQQRDYHAMERNALITELQVVKELLQKRSKLLVKIEIDKSFKILHLFEFTFSFRGKHLKGIESWWVMLKMPTKRFTSLVWNIYAWKMNTVIALRLTPQTKCFFGWEIVWKNGSVTTALFQFINFFIMYLCMYLLFKTKINTYNFD